MNHFLTPIVIQRIDRDQTATCFFSDQLGVLLVKLPLDKHDFRIMFPCGLDQFFNCAGDGSFPSISMQSWVKPYSLAK